ncbi:MAG: PIN domain-containing protein [Nitrococcus sp.]|nr:PIN domain-containing protein [Nitrococcus sp.]
MSVECFIDTNLFIYQLEARDERKGAIADHIIRHGIEGGTACISFQVIQECLNTMLRKAEIQLSTEETRSYLETVLEPLFRVSANISLYQHALGIRARYRYGFYDALIIAAALDAGCTRLYSEDLQHGQRIGELIIENPFLS